jgi:serine/threonine protein phosphatase PrpC
VTAMAGSTELQWGGASDVGRVRAINQDNFLARADLGLWAVADGMGGHRGGEIASRIACETVDRSYAARTVEGLVDAVESANAAVFHAGSGDPDLTGMGTTIVAIALVDDGHGDSVLAIANVGDSRAYRLAVANELEQLTNDHSLVADLVREGSLSPEEAAVHPQRNILTRVLGVYDDVPVDIVTVVPHNGDRYVLCSDGLFNEVPEPAIASVLRRLADPTEAANELVRLANEGGGRDNVTVVVVDVVDDAGRASAASAALADAGTRDRGRGRTAEAGARGGARDGDTATHAAVGDGDLVIEERTRRGRARSRRRSGDTEPRHAAAPKARRFTWRVALFVVLLLALVGGAFATIQWYGQSTYFVGFAGDNVAIFRGRPGGLLWIEPDLVEPTDLERSRVPADRVDDVQAGVEQGSQADAEAYVARLTERAEQQNPTTTTTASTSTTAATTSTTRPTTTTAPSLPG